MTQDEFNNAKEIMAKITKCDLALKRLDIPDGFCGLKIISDGFDEDFTEHIDDILREISDILVPYYQSRKAKLEKELADL